jgi:murein DD-endopeptidase MepM/ murein hydrolase activator NlpD
LFLADDQSLQLAGGTNARSFRRALVERPLPTRTELWRERLLAVDWVPDLGQRIGSREWWRGLATCTALCAATISLAPPFRPMVAAVPAPLAGTEWDEARAQGIAPIAWGADTGRRMAANDLVRPLAEAPERPLIDLTATLGAGDRLTAALQRAGVGRRDAEDAAALIAGVVSPEDIAAGTPLSLTLGRRASKTVARPLQSLKLRARFDMAVTVARSGGTLAMTRQPIAVDRTPLRLQGPVGSSLYRSARAAGAPAQAVEQFLKALATRVSLGRDVGSNDRYDMVIERERAATGETRLGKLLLVGLERGGKPLRLVRWTDNGRDSWWDPAGQSERRGALAMPVAGRVSSSFGARNHPLLGFFRFHAGIDIAAPRGTPVHAASDGIISFAGRSGGYGNLLRVTHGGGIETRYGHLSSFAVRGGTRVSRGQVIAYVGTTGLSTGPHLHWEVRKNGRAVNPRSVSFDQVARLSGDTLRRMKARVAELIAVRPGS